MIKRIRILMPILVILAMLASMLGMAIPLAADFDPADSNANSINLDLIRPNLEYHIGDTIYFSVIVSTPVAIPAANFYPGKNTDVVITFTRPDGVPIVFDTIAELNRGDMLVFDHTDYPGLAYVIDSADASALGVVTAQASVVAISHCSVTGPAPGGNEYASNFREISTQITIAPDICIEKLVDCNDDQEYLHEDNGSYGDTPSWYIKVWNCGDSPLLDVMVSDTNGMSWGPFDLENPGDFWDVYYDGDPIFETTTNEATASATDVLGGTVGPVYDSATNVVEIFPDICIEKLVDCNDDQVYLAEDTGSYGDTPSWYIKVTNCGDSPLLDVYVSDTNGMSWGPFDLENPGDFWEVYYDGDPIFETTTNEAGAYATDVLGGTVGPVYDSATNVVEIFPDICIEKLVDCNDDQVYLAEDTGSYGDTPSWYIRVWNCGDSPLLDVYVSDTNGMSWGPFDLENPGDFWEVYYDGDPIFETTTNEATASATDVLGGTVGPVYDSATNIITGNEGCTPGYWKNNAVNWDAVAWEPTPYRPEMLVGDVFDIPGCVSDLAGDSLLQALSYKGGKGVMGAAQILLRAAVAALLNASHPDINYYMSEAGVIAAVNAALATCDRATMLVLYEELDFHNNDGCVLDMHGDPIIPIVGIVW